MPLKCCMIEPCEPGDRGSIGTHYVAEHARAAGHHVEFTQRTSANYDVELFSLHHCTDYLRFATMPKRARWRIVGGHVTFNNCRPVIPFADIVCVGEGESWIGSALSRLEEHGDAKAMLDLPGTIVSELWEPGASIPASLFENPLPCNSPYLNRPGTRSAAWYVEIARGCPYRCDYCELGHGVQYRQYETEYLKSVLDGIDTRVTRKINFYAPDEASHPGYPELMQHLRTRGFAAGFASMRIESILRHPPPVLANMLIRVGVDGLTEAARFRVGKKITNDLLWTYFRELTGRGHVMFKMFMVFGFPWETLADFREWRETMDRVLRLPLDKNVSLRIKWTPFIPQPCTPLGRESPHYDPEMVVEIRRWHAEHQYPRSEPGFWCTDDGIMSKRTHDLQCRLTSGDEGAILRLPGARPLRAITG